MLPEELTKSRFIFRQHVFSRPLYVKTGLLLKLVDLALKNFFKAHNTESHREKYTVFSSPITELKQTGYLPLADK